MVLTTINGIAFAQKIPLVGCDGLVALADQMVIQVATAQHQPELIVALLNAYNNEAYYHMRRRQKDGSYEPVSQSGYAHIDDVITMVLKENAQSVWCGNGANVYREVLLQRLGSNAHVDNVLRNASLDTFAHQALALWQNQPHPVYNLQPEYLKTQSFVKAN